MKKKILAIFMALAMVFTSIAFTPSVSFAAKHGNKYSQKYHKDVYGQYAYSVLKYMDKNLTQRIAGTEQEVKAAEYIKRELKSFGYDVEIQPFSYTRKGVTYNSQNVVATKKGQSSKEIIVGAHYDSVKTNGVDDNGSGTVVNLETAKRVARKKTPYTIKFVFFGAEEVGLKGSKAYSDAMTAEEVQNTLYMVNMDSMLAGTYRYLYSGVYNSATGVVENAWPAEQAMKLADALGTGMRFNNTELNYDYPTPSTGTWSDHASFRNKMPYLYFEAANWELPDDPEHPEWGSSGAYETETGEVMHVPGRDDLTFIETTWGNRGRCTIAAYCKLLDNVLYQLHPDGLITPSKDELNEAINEATNMKDTFLSKQDAKMLEAALQSANKVNETEYVLLKDQAVIDNATKKLEKTVKSIENKVKVTVKNNGKKQQKQIITVKYGNRVLREGKDYTISYVEDEDLVVTNDVESEEVEAKSFKHKHDKEEDKQKETIKVLITGMRNYQGSVEVTLKNRR